MYRKGFAVQLRSAAALRSAFIVQVLGMILNDIALVASWLFFFDFFGSVNGWSAAELIGLQGINMVVFGLMMLASGGITELPRHIDRGSFDNALVKPCSVLIQLSNGKLDVTLFGDLVLGTLLLGWYIVHVGVSVTEMALFMAALLASCVIFWSLAILLPSVLAFYVYDSDQLSRNVGAMLLDSAIYPTGILTGVMRAVFLTLVPGLLMGAVPLDVLRGLNWPLVGLGFVVALIWLTISLWLFRYSVRRYESANLIGAR